MAAPSVGARDVRDITIPSFLVPQPHVVLGTKRTVSEIEAIISKALTDLKGEMTCSNDIISRSECVILLNEEALLSSYYQKFGEKFLNALQYHMKLVEMRNATDLAVDQLGTKLTYPISSQPMAVAGFRVGECGETNSTLAVKCNLMGLNTLTLFVGREPGPLSGREDAHQIILVGVDFEKFEKLMCLHHGLLIPLLKGLKEGFVLDGFLTTFFSVKKLETKGAHFLKYMKNYAFKWIKNYVHMEDKELSLVPIVQKDAALIFKEAKGIIADGKNILCGGRLSEFSNLKAVERNVTALGIIIELKKIFPKLDITWKKNLKDVDSKIWAEGSKDDIERVSKHLHGLGIEMNLSQMKSKSGDAMKYAGFLIDPNLMKFRAINFPVKAEEACTPVGAAAPAAPPVSASAPAAPTAPAAPVEEKKALPGS